LLFSTVMLHKALEAALEALAEMHEHESDAWLDHLEAQALLRAKASLRQGIAEETEAGPAKAGLQIVEELFESFRNRTVRP